MDNPVLKITGETLKDLQHILSYVIPNGKVHGYTVDGNNTRMVLYRYETAKATPFPAPLPAEQAAEIVMAWLRGGADYGERTIDDEDVSCGKGFYAYRDEWGFVDGYGSPSFIAIEPYWCWYGR